MVSLVELNNLQSLSHCENTPMLVTETVVPSLENSMLFMIFDSEDILSISAILQMITSNPFPDGNAIFQKILCNHTILFNKLSTDDVSTEWLSLEGSVEDSNGLEGLKYVKDVISRFACKKETLRQ